MLDDKPYNLDRIFRLAFSVAIIWGLLCLLDYLSDVLIPFAVACLLAYLLNPLVNRLQTWLGHRLISILLALILVLATAGASLWWAGPHVAHEVHHLGQVVAGVARDGPLARKVTSRFGPRLAGLAREAAADPRIKEYIESEDLVSTLRKGISSLIQTVLPRAVGALKGTWNLILGLLGLSIIGLYLIFLLLDYDVLRRGWQTLVPSSCRQGLVTFVADFDLMMNRYFRAQAFVALILGILFALGFSLIGLPLAILFGLFVGALNMVPYLQILALPPALALAAVHALEQESSVGIACLLVLAVFAVVQLVQDAILVPRIMGKVTGLSPAMILLSLSVWGKLLGLLGLLLALPMTCLLLSAYRQQMGTVPKK